MSALFSLAYIMKCVFDLMFIDFILEHKFKFRKFFSNPFNILKVLFISSMIITIAVKVGIYGEILYPAVADELNICEGNCIVEGGSRYNKIFIDGERYHFGIMSMGKNNNFYFYEKLNNKNIKVLYKGEVFHNVYQLEMDGHIVYSLSEANEEVLIYNINIITMPYILTFLVVLLFFLERMKDEGAETNEK